MVLLGAYLWTDAGIPAGLEGSVTAYDNMAMQNHLNVQKLYPEIGGMDPRPLMEASVHTLFTDVIEVAERWKVRPGQTFALPLV